MNPSALSRAPAAGSGRAFPIDTDNLALERTERPTRRGGCRRLPVFALTIAMVGALTTLATAQVTLTAHAIASDFPNVSGRFEDTVITQWQYAPNWAPWIMSPLVSGGGQVSGAGIARVGASILGASANPPEGRYVAFIEGGGIAQCQAQFAAGTWRLRFFGAQRRQGAQPDKQRIRVEVVSATGTVTVFDEQIADATFDEYVTEPFVVPAAAILGVRFVGLVPQGTQNMALIDRVLLDRVQPWHDPATWGGTVPTATTDVAIDADAAVLLDGTCVAQSVSDNGHLVADRINGSLTAHWVMVMGPTARFIVGTEALPFQQQFTLTLDATNTSENIMGAGTKFLMAMDGGHVDMHGVPTVSWTKLAGIAGSQITLTQPVSWGVGDQIVVATSSLCDQAGPSGVRSEVRTITGAGTALTLNQPLLGQHVTAAPRQWQTPSGSHAWQLDERAEVGLLSHNVKIEGDAGSSQTLFGAHVMMMFTGFGRFSHVQFTRVGQVHLLGRYPFHWHMQMANGRGQYIRGCSIRESYNRAITIHGTDFATVEDNVALDHLGHGIFLEDGGEQHNRIAHNLVLQSRKPTQAQALLQTDYFFNEAQNRSPAAFWITNPNNEFVDNVAADTEGTGFWFALHPQPFGLSSQAPYAPYFASVHGTTAPLGAFSGNVSHSCASGIDLNDAVNDDPTRTLAPNVGWLPPSTTTLPFFTAHCCATGIYAGDGSDSIVFADAVTADCEWHVQLACGFEVVDSLLVEDTHNGVFLPIHPSFSGQAYVVYDGPGRLTRCHLDGFNGTGTHQFAANSEVVSSVFGAAFRHTNHEFSRLSYQNGTFPNIDFDDFVNANPATSLPDARHWGIAVHDNDGSLSGGAYPNRTLITNHPMMHMFSATQTTPDVTFAGWTNAYLSPFRWGHLVLWHDDSAGNSLSKAAQPDMLFTRNTFEGWRGSSYLYDRHVDPYRQIPMVVRRPTDPATREVWYGVDWTAPASAARIRIVVDDIPPGDVARLQLHKAGGWNNPVVSVNGSTLTPVSLQTLPTLTQTGYSLPPVSGPKPDLWLRIVKTNDDRPIIITF